MKLVLALALALVTGCSSLAGTRPVGVPQASSDDCSSYDAAHMRWGGVAAGAGLLGGSAGLTAVSVDDKTLRTSLAISSAVMGAVAAGAAYLSNQNASRFSERCK